MVGQRQKSRKQEIRNGHKSSDNEDMDERALNGSLWIYLINTRIDANVNVCIYIHCSRPSSDVTQRERVRVRGVLSFFGFISFYVQVMLPIRQEERNEREGRPFNRAFGFAHPDKNEREREFIRGI